MALTAKDKEFIAGLIAQALTSVPTGTPAAPAASDHIGPSGKPDGRRFPCTADGGCGRLLRSAARASVHATGAALKETGHTPA